MDPLHPPRPDAAAAHGPAAADPGGLPAPTSADAAAVLADLPRRDEAPRSVLSPAPPEFRPGHRPPETSVPDLLPMLLFRLIGAVALVVGFALVALQTYRVVEDTTLAEDTWSDALTWWAVLAGVIAGGAVLAWTWAVTENARRLLAPASTRELPDPRRALATWVLPFSFATVATAVVAVLAERHETSPDGSSSSLPLAVAVLSLVLVIPMTYRPVNHLAGVIRQLGGYSVELARWMWVPVMLALMGVVSIVLLRIGGAVEDTGDELAPLWVVAVVGIAPCVVVILLMWRAATLVEEAITFAVRRRRGPLSDVGPTRRRTGVSKVDVRQHVRQVPGADLLRLALVSALAGLALLGVVGAIVMVLFWQESRDGLIGATDSERAWDALRALHDVERVVAFAVLALASVWTFVTVLNVRLASGRRRNPLVAALSWPAAGAALWIIADRWIVDQPAGTVVAGLAAQAAVLYVPFILLERAAEAVGARRTPIRIAYVFAVVLLVHIQGLAGLATITQTNDTAEYGRLAWYLAIGAVVQLLSTLAVTEATRAISGAAAREAEHHNFLAGQRRVAAQAKPAGPVAAPGPTVSELPGPAVGEHSVDEPSPERIGG